MMIDQVIADSGHFFTLFIINIIFFAQIFNLMVVDVSVYQRMPIVAPNLISQILHTFRSTMGAFSVIDPYQTFDLLDYEIDNQKKKKNYRHS